MTEIQTLQANEALGNARNGQSALNYGFIFEGFKGKGIPESEIIPRVNVFTFKAWLALGRAVRKGEHGVSCLTWIPMSKTDKETGEVKTGRRPKSVTVFHISQTDELK